MFFNLSLFVSVVFVLLSVMFITLLERKLLSYSQTRMGPNKVGWLGLIQPMLDGFKLILKEMFNFSFINKFMFGFGPILFITIMFLIWMSLPHLYYLSSFVFSLVFLMVCIGVGVYSSLISGWSSNSKYSMIGSIRSMAQTVSYEIGLAIMFFVFLILVSSFSLMSLSKVNSFYFFSMFFPMFLIFFLSVVAECNRAPFDFAEGESELVSGFNTEYFSLYFAFLFIAEYGMILFFCLLMGLMFFSNGLGFSVVFFMLMILLILLIRSVYPRFRYDKLMFLVWFKMLPIVIFFSLLFFYFFSFYMMKAMATEFMPHFWNFPL